MSLLWDQVEPAKGKLEWSRLDGIVASLRAAGVEPVLAISGSPPWANGIPESRPNHDLYVPPQGKALDVWVRNYSSFLAAAVKRYDRFVRRWEVWPQPNLAASWRPRPEPAAYRELYTRLRGTILQREPDADVAVGGLAELTVARAPDLSGLAFLGSLIRARTPLGSVAVQPYTTNEHAPDVHEAGQNNFDDINRVHRLLLRGGVRASMWVTGWGWSSNTVGQQRQTQYVDGSLTLLENRYPFVRLATYSLDHDVPPKLFGGLLRASLKPKPAASAFRAHADLAAIRCRTRMALAAPGSTGVRHE